MNRQMDVVFITCKDDAGHRFSVPRRTLERDAAEGREPSRRCPECAERNRREKRRMAAPYLIARVGRTSPPSPWELPLARVAHPDPDVQAATVNGSDDGFSFTITVEDVAAVFEAFETNQVVVVSAGTGSGKSSRLVADLAMGLGPTQPGFSSRGQVIVTQPRKRATEGCARALAQLLGSGPGPGQAVGYRHKDRNLSDSRNDIVVATDGTILQRLRTSDLAGISLLVLDEVHEATENIELLLARVAELLPRFRDIRLLLLSATIDSAPFVAAFGGADQVRVFEFAGSPKEITIHWPTPESALRYDDPKRTVQLVRDAAIVTAIDVLSRGFRGETALEDVLIFVPRQDDVEHAVARIREIVESKFAHRILVLPLTKDVGRQTQERACEPRSNEFDVKVVVATPVAETSLTIHGLGHVVDSGLTLVKRFDGRTHADIYEVRPHTRAGIRQRWGRVGRTRPGHVWPVYSEAQFATFEEHARSGLDGANLEVPLLTLAAGGVRDFDKTPFTHPIDRDEATRARMALVSSRLLLEDGELTRLGLEVSEMRLPRRDAELLVLADRLACSFEASMLVELSNVWGTVWNWDHGWDGASKGAVVDRRQALQTGCVDDLDLGIRVAAGWLGLLPGQQVAGARWADAFGLNSDALDRFERSWSALWSRIAARTRREERRIVDPATVAKVRGILAVQFRSSHFVSAEDGFERYGPGGVVRLLLDRSTTIQGGTTLRVAPLVETHVGHYRDVALVRGALLTACPDLGTAPTGMLALSLLIKRAISDGRLLVGCYADAPAPVGSFVHVVGGHVLRAAPAPPPLLVRIGDAKPVTNGAPRASLVSSCEVPALWSDRSTADGTGIVEGYDGERAIVRPSTVPVPGLLEFAQSTRVGASVRVVVVGVRRIPGDTDLLVVEHSESGLRICVGPEELGIADDNGLAPHLESGSTLELSVEELDIEHERVVLSAILKVAGDFVDVLTRPFVNAVVVRRNSHVSHLRFSSTHGGWLHEVRVHERLPASIDGLLRVRLSMPADRITSATFHDGGSTLLRLSQNMADIIYDPAAATLRVRGRLPVAALRSLLAVASPSERRVVRSLWRRSASPTMEPLTDTEVAAFFSTATPGCRLRARIIAVSDSSVRLDLGFGISGRILRRDLPFDMSLVQVGAPGDVIDVWLTQVDKPRMQVRVTPFDWTNEWAPLTIVAGQHVTARVGWIPDDASCVNLELGDGIVGRTSMSDLVGGIKTEDFVVGSTIQVVVQRVDPERRRIAAVPEDVVEAFRSMASMYPSGTRLIGRITGVHHFGALMDIGSGVTALLPRRLFAGRMFRDNEDVTVTLVEIDHERCRVIVR